MSGDLDLSAVLAASVPAPSIEYLTLSPMLIVFGAAVIGVLVETFVARRYRYRTQLLLAFGGLVAALVAVILLAGTEATAAVGAVAVDGVTLFLQGTLLLVSILALAFIAERVPRQRVRSGPGTWSRAAATSERGMVAFTPQASAVPGSAAEKAAAASGAVATEVFPLTMLAIGGLLLFPASNDLLTMFVALEVLSLPLYLLCGLARRRRLLSQEAALKYFLLGAFSSAFFLYGVALLYGQAGTVQLAGIADAIAADSGSTTLALLGTAMLAVGLLFKVGAVPFQAWVPDVYQGAPTPITAFMAAATKIAAVGALLRVLHIAVPQLAPDWRPVLAAVCIATMLVGAVMAITQTDIKRMLAYSSVAHAGFLLTALVAANDAGVSSVLFYLLIYGLGTLGAFAVVSLVRDASGTEATALSQWAGLGRSNPRLAAVFALLLLSFAGLPLTGGFVAKFAVFQAAGAGDAATLVIVGVIASAIAAFFYIRVIVLMFFTEPPADPPVVSTPAATTALIAVTGAATLVLGIVPQPVLELAERAAVFAQ
ncbi:NADH-quinone oxidoreductase subunit NuoN [Nocardia donostiensis]|uniref:NADH-quinone oxidoreductase subunit N n=1 Tax=Nocardia donostiensis TaxID=1538463 RepID=A0A1V2TKV0_9NOCA|nr:NADH-quinone oxidoreductase subunit NuoN [Nocardia donostiensis]ONM50106.1 NADH-quinone oxidoreductase subunit N [Nocardia donostiensis]OQS15768.1 NADH-quinone oxidoreductase subunit N [Nocardia donostiensis]OQS23573.1 NADH-quinone oxidoreductase subunit N [Nocardia donostiensis]